MVMDTLQIRLNKQLMKRIDTLVNSGIYANRSEVIRDAVRRFVWEREKGSINYLGKSEEVVRSAREELSKEKIDLKKLNNL